MFFIFYSHAQELRLVVEYKLQLVMDDRLENIIKNSDVPEYKYKLLHELDDEDNYLYTLQVSDTISKFFISGYTFDKNTTHEDLANKLISLSEYQGTSFYYKQNYYYFYKFLKSFTYQPIENNWVLTNETKEIDGYTVYKATSTRTIINPVGTFVFPVVAWYCPEIPYKYGPIGFGNLPGLILHLKYKNAEYQITKINFKPKDKIDVDLFQKYPKESIDEPFDEESFKPIKN